MCTYNVVVNIIKYLFVVVYTKRWLLFFGQFFFFIFCPALVSFYLGRFFFVIFLYVFHSSCDACKYRYVVKKVTNISNIIVGKSIIKCNFYYIYHNYIELTCGYLTFNLKSYFFYCR